MKYEIGLLSATFAVEWSNGLVSLCIEYLNLGTTEIEKRIGSVTFSFLGLATDFLPSLRTQDGSLFAGQNRGGSIGRTGQTLLPFGYRSRSRLQKHIALDYSSQSAAILKLDSLKTAQEEGQADEKQEAKQEQDQQCDSMWLNVTQCD